MGSLWHPFAPMAHVAEHPFVVVRGEGAYVFDEAGRRYLDGTASLWYANIGYGRSEVANAVARQMETLHAYHLFVDFATPPALELADRIASLAPIEGSKVFLTSGGSDAVDTAAKLARRYFHEIGQPERTVLIAREWAYHGMHGFGTSFGGDGAQPFRLRAPHRGCCARPARRSRGGGEGDRPRRGGAGGGDDL